MVLHLLCVLNRHVFLQCTVVSHLACVRVGAVAVGSAPVFVSAEVCLVQVQQCVLNACSCGAKFGNIFIQMFTSVLPAVELN